MSKVERLKPVNRHLLIVPHFKKSETPTGVILPDDYTPEEKRHIEATVIDVADDCDKQFRHLKYGNIGNDRIVVDSSMIEELKIKDATHYIILQNYVVGIYRRPHAH